MRVGTWNSLEWLWVFQPNLTYESWTCRWLHMSNLLYLIMILRGQLTMPHEEPLMKNIGIFLKRGNVIFKTTFRRRYLVLKHFSAIWHLVLTHASVVVYWIPEANDVITNFTYFPPNHRIKIRNQMLWNVIISGSSCGMVSCLHQIIVKYNRFDVWSQPHVHDL